MLKAWRTGKTHTEETKKLMSISRSGKGNANYGKLHTDLTKDLIRNTRLGKSLSSETRTRISKSNGTTVYLYQIDIECRTHQSQSLKGEVLLSPSMPSNNNFILVDKFNSFRSAGKYLNISQSTVSRYIKSGDIFNGKYKFLSSLL